MSAVDFNTFNENVVIYIVYTGYGKRKKYEKRVRMLQEKSEYVAR